MIIPSSVTQIGVNAFYECSSLSSVTIPLGHKDVWPRSELLIVVVRDHPPRSRRLAIKRSWLLSLSSVTIPSSVTQIGVNAFYECSSLSSVTIPSSVTQIGDRAFYGCSSLSSVTIPSSVKLGTGAFDYKTTVTRADASLAA